MGGKLQQEQMDFIKSEIRKNVYTTDELRWSNNSNVSCNWDYLGFKSERACEIAHQEYKISCQIRTYCRRNKLTTRKGSYHSFDCRNEHQQLWSMVSAGSQDGNVAGVRWCYRTVDGLKNLYIWFK